MSATGIVEGHIDDCGSEDSNADNVYARLAVAPSIYVFQMMDKAMPVIAWAMPAGLTYGAALGATELNAAASFGGAEVGGILVYTPAAGAVLNAGAGQTLSVTFTPTDTANYTTATKTVTIDIGKATPVVTWLNPANIVYGMPLSSTQLNATASVAGGFV